MKNKKSEIRLYLEWDSYLQSDLENIYEHINAAVKRMKSKNFLYTSSNLEIGEEFDETSYEHNLVLNEGGKLLVKKVTGPLQMLESFGIRRIIVVLTPNDGQAVTSTKNGRLLYGVLSRISKKMAKMKKEESFILAQAS